MKKQSFGKKRKAGEFLTTTQLGGAATKKSGEWRVASDEWAKAGGRKLGSGRKKAQKRRGI